MSGFFLVGHVGYDGNANRWLSTNIGLQVILGTCNIKGARLILDFFCFFLDFFSFFGFPMCFPSFFGIFLSFC